jgi:predicted site-specific integrase-resolvase
MNSNNLIRIGELAERLQVSTVTIRNWMESGVIPKSSYIAVPGDNRTTYRFDYDKVRDHLSADNAEGRKQLELDL